MTELQVFSDTAEVKVDPDKPLEGARMAVLQVAGTLVKKKQTDLGFSVTDV